MRKYLFLVVLALTLSLNAQEIPEHISYSGVYDLLDELASEKIIDLNSVVKPYSRQFIAQKLMDANASKALLSYRQQEEIRFFINEFALELDQMPHALVPLRCSANSSVGLLPAVYHYKDSLFRARISPILGMQISNNTEGTATKRWYGVEMQTMIGKHLSMYGSIRDYSFTGGLLARPQYLNNLPGCEYTNKQTATTGDYSDCRGGIVYSWNWGSVGLIKDNIVWGDNYHGSNILSGRAPSFPMFTFHLKPVKWFEMQYIHGWLVSNVTDSTRYYLDNENNRQYRMTNKFLAANMFTFTPIPHLNLSFGNSIVYAETDLQPSFLIPFAFYKSMDHSMSKGISGMENQNSQMFFNISSRNIKHLHVFGCFYFDEFSVSRLKSGNPEKNPLSAKLGAKLSNFPISNLSVTGEWTQTNMISYKHSIPALTWASNGYNLGHYLGDNAQETYVALNYKPIRGLDLNVSYTNAKHGNEYAYLRRDADGADAVKRIISQPLMKDVVWTNKTMAFNAQYEVFANAYAVVNVSMSDIQGHDTNSTKIPGESGITKAADFLNLYTPVYLQGKKTTVTVSFSLGF